MTDKTELPADDDTGERFTEEALAARADAAPSPVTETTWDANSSRTKDEEAALYHSGSDADVALYSSNNLREAATWHGLIVEKRQLQRAGFGCWFVDGKKRFAGRRTQWIAVGKAVVTHAEFRAWAERTRRTARQQRDDA